jgi:hypothetical protein
MQRCSAARQGIATAWGGSASAVLQRRQSLPDDSCNRDAQDPNNGCTNTPNTTPCDDDGNCTTNDACGGGVCTGVGFMICDDSNARSRR